MNRNTARMLLSLGCLSILAACAGTPNDEQFFNSEAEVRDVDRFAAAHASAGARAEGTLRGLHFDGARLNSLGRSELHLMLQDRPTSQPLVVYLDLPKEQVTDRRAQVAAYLQGSGLSTSDYDLRVGPNPDISSSADANIKRMERTESLPGAGVSGSGYKSSMAPSGTR